MSRGLSMLSINLRWVYFFQMHFVFQSVACKALNTAKAASDRRVKSTTLTFSALNLEIALTLSSKCINLLCHGGVIDEQFHLWLKNDESFSDHSPENEPGEVIPVWPVALLRYVYSVTLKIFSPNIQQNAFKTTPISHTPRNDLCTTDGS